MRIKLEINVQGRDLNLTYDPEYYSSKSPAQHMASELGEMLRIVERVYGVEVPR